MSAAWSIPVQEKSKYDQIFDGLLPVNGLLSGDKVKPILLNSKLPVEVLGKVWELSDIDSDGFLDRDEFTVAMHLVYRALEKIPVPNQLPPEMIPISKRNQPIPVLPSMAPVIPVVSGYTPHIIPSVLPRAPGVPGIPVPIVSTGRIVITPAERASYDDTFVKLDMDKDGFINGANIKDIFLQSGLPQIVLAHIWNLCDTTTSGKLNKDQFALAMHLIQQKLKGIEVPMQITPDMLPVSIQLPSAESLAVASFVQFDQSKMKELDDISKEIEELKREKMRLEQEKAQREADIKIQEGEISNLQKDLDGLLFTVKQLESQKCEAQKKLEELDEQKVKLQKSVAECKEKYETDQKQIQDLRNQINNKGSQNKESEMKKLKEEIAEFEKQENELKMRYSIEINNEKKLNQKLSQLEAIIAETSSDIEDLKGKLSQEDILLASNLATASFNPKNEVDVQLDVFKTDMDKFDVDPFLNEPCENVVDVFKSEDPFASADPFSNPLSDPFGGDPFKDAFEEDAPSQVFFAFPSSQDSKADVSDPWGGGCTKLMNDLDCFDPFGASTSKSEFEHDATDPFGTGFFLPPKVSSTTASAISALSGSPHLPVLPPKQKKTPVPPRPPAPKPNDSLPGGQMGFIDPFDVRPAIGRSSKKDPNVPKFHSEAEQLAWAKRDSEEEYERLRRIREREEEDLKLAIALSRQEK